MGKNSANVGNACLGTRRKVGGMIARQSVRRARAVVRKTLCATVRACVRVPPVVSAKICKNMRSSRK